MTTPTPRDLRAEIIAALGEVPPWLITTDPAELEAVAAALVTTLGLDAHPDGWTPNHPAADLRRVLQDHYLFQVACDHDRKLDKPICACSRINLGWYSSVGDAVNAWIDHTLGMLDLAAWTPGHPAVEALRALRPGLASLGRDIALEDDVDPVRVALEMLSAAEGFRTKLTEALDELSSDEATLLTRARALVASEQELTERGKALAERTQEALRLRTEAEQARAENARLRQQRDEARRERDTARGMWMELHHALAYEAGTTWDLSSSEAQTAAHDAIDAITKRRNEAREAQRRAEANRDAIAKSLDRLYGGVGALATLYEREAAQARRRSGQYATIGDRARQHLRGALEAWGDAARRLRALLDDPNGGTSTPTTGEPGPEVRRDEPTPTEAAQGESGMSTGEVGNRQAPVGWDTRSRSWSYTCGLCRSVSGGWVSETTAEAFYARHLRHSHPAETPPQAASGSAEAGEGSEAQKGAGA